MEYDLNALRGRKAGLILQENCKKSAVIIPLIKDGEEIRVLFEVRSEKIGRQPGDVCFPGGRLLEDETPEQAAVRETCEELLAEPSQLELICACDVFHNSSNIVYPFAAWLSGYDGRFSDDEVAAVFTVPLEFFITAEPVICDSRMVRVTDDVFPYHLINGGRDYKWPARLDKELFYSYEGRTIWGISARILKGFVDLLR